MVVGDCRRDSPGPANRETSTAYVMYLFLELGRHRSCRQVAPQRGNYDAVVTELSLNE